MDDLTNCGPINRRRWLAVLVAVLALTTLGGCLVAVHDHHPDKVLVCHKGKKTLSVSSAALAAHLDHGDYRGRCR